ncbi:MAG: preprotein translocase subunit YajC [Mariprofundaceae bacterium]
MTTFDALRLGLLTLSITLLTATPAIAEGESGGGAASLVPLILIMVIFYFLLIRPQQKKLKEHKSMVETLSKGDAIITSGGIYGSIHAVKEDHLMIDIADNVRIKVKRDTISEVANKDSDSN